MKFFQSQFNNRSTAVIKIEKKKKKTLYASSITLFIKK